VTRGFTWKVAPVDQAAEKTLVSGLGVEPLVARLLVNRGISNTGAAKAYLNPALSGVLDPLSLVSMNEAVERILLALEKREKIVVYGDFDVDGLTATATLWLFLKELDADVDYLVPNRFTDGHGLSTRAVESMKSCGAGLVITVDTGANDVDAVDLANSIGLDVIITDHHRITRPLPDAVAVINPARDDCDYPFKSLAGVGVCFKLCMAIRGGLHRKNGVSRDKLPNLRKYLDLVALGSVADCVSLTGENRIFVHAGLVELSNKSRVGLKELINVSRINGEQVTSRDLGFELAPRLNSAGRLGGAEPALELMITSRKEKARQIALFLDESNQKRKNLQNEILHQARDMAMEQTDLDNEKAIVLASDRWAPGINGIVASKLVEEFNLPTVLVSFEGENGRGSGRSVPPFDLGAAVASCGSVLEKFGGHRAAAGLAIRKERFDEFRSMFLEHAREALTNVDLARTVLADSEADPGELTLSLVKAMGMLEPFGQDNPQPVFVGRNVRFDPEPYFMGDEKKHVRLKTDGHNEKIDVVGFNMACLFRDHYFHSASFDILYTPEINTWRDRERLQLRLMGVHPSRKLADN